MIAALLLAAVLSLPDSVAVAQSGATFHRMGAAHVARFPMLTVARVDADSAGFRPCRACFAPKARKGKPFDRLKGGKP